MFFSWKISFIFLRRCKISKSPGPHNTELCIFWIEVSRFKILNSEADFRKTCFLFQVDLVVVLN